MWGQCQYTEQGELLGQEWLHGLCGIPWMELGAGRAPRAMSCVWLQVSLRQCPVSLVGAQGLTPSSSLEHSMELLLEPRGMWLILDTPGLQDIPTPWAGATSAPPQFREEDGALQLFVPRN